jgi:hypothetical protein
VKALLVGALAATLAGCTCHPRSLPTAAQTVSKPMVFKANAQNAKSTLAANTQNSQSAEFGKKASVVAKRAKHSIVGKMEPSASARFNDKSDPVTKKAKAAIAAMMENPASAEFGEMKRAVKNLAGEPLDTICGYVTGKNRSGRNTGKMPFLYIIQDEEAYLVDGSSPVADMLYLTLCN